ncbi:MAG: CBS domain-containing protein [Blastocatellia bacterium]
MSRSKEGMDKEKNAATSRQADESSGSDYLDKRLGAKGQTDYTAGRESWREFPKRSTSLRARTDTDTESRDLYDSSSRRDYETRSGTRNVNRYESPYQVRNESRGSYPDYPRGAGRFGRYDRANQAESQEYGRNQEYGRHTYDDLRYGRADHEDFPRSQGRYRADERGYDYERNDYRQERNPYDEPYSRQSVNDRYDYQDFDARDTQRDWRGREANYLRCSDIMTKDVTICSPQTVLREVADKMQDDNVGSIPVVDGGRLVGIVTDRDIVCRVIADGHDTRTTPVSAAMSEDLVTCTPDESVIDAIRKMGEHQIRRIPVCDINGRIRGIIAMADIALEAERDRDLAGALEQISKPTPNRSRRV